MTSLMVKAPALSRHSLVCGVKKTCIITRGIGAGEVILTDGINSRTSGRPSRNLGPIDARRGTRNQCLGSRRTRSIASRSTVGQTQRFSPSDVVEFFPGNGEVMDPRLSMVLCSSTDYALVDANNKNRQTDDGFTPTIILLAIVVQLRDYRDYHQQVVPPFPSSPLALLGSL